MSDSPRQSQAAYWSVCLLILVALIDSQVVSAIAPQIAAGVGSAKTSVAASAATYSIFNAAVAFGLGGFGRRIVPTRGLPIAAMFAVAAAVLAAVAPNVWVFHAARAVAGVSGGLTSALGIAALANSSSYAKRGSQMSGVAISYFLAPVIGVPLGTFLTGRFGWASAFWCAAALVAGAGAMVSIFRLPELPKSATTVDEKLTIGGAFSNLWKLATRSRSAVLGIVSAAFVSGGLVGFSAFLGVWLSDAFRADESQVGIVFGVTGIGAVAGGFAGGKLADRFGKRYVALTASLWMAFGLLLVPTFAWTSALFIAVAAAALFASLRVAPLQALVSEMVAPGERAAFIALRNGVSQLGIVATVWLAGLAYGRAGFFGVGLVCSTVTLAAWVCIRFMEEPKREKSTGELTTAPLSKPRRLPRMVTIPLTVVFVILIGFPYLLSLAVTKAGTRSIERDRADTPAALGAEFEAVTFESAGVKLSGWYLPTRTQGATIILTHGLFRSRYEMLERGVALWKLGYGVLLYDLRRHGKSTGEFSTIGWAERRDVKAAADFVHARAPYDKIVLLGVSMGAAATLLAASEMSGVSAVIADSSFISFNASVRNDTRNLGLPVIPFAPMMTYITAFRMGFSVSEFDIEQAVRRTPTPILFIGGDQDVRMPIATTLEPLFRAGRNPLNEKHVVAGAAHGKAYEVSPRQYVETVDAFVRKVLAHPHA